ncbi:spermidine synthase [Scytonema hofmannii PCC 7110]|uniref:S-adenosylmethionine decarboxylase proenzyme n=1 Tax=Scytonema hofmannii PCC 7110 TaxID=128403 RepID=A0A139XBQ6_9CYAN|nr:adenosylmethionine decarboxylase [Scytonema hofmannii]KYC42137.1 spermidine synthase [Scytonema hofmannii PCC 7110]
MLSYPVGGIPLVPVGRHCILELYNCPTHLLNNPVFMKQALEEAAKVAKSTLLSELTHHFEPYGVTGLALLAESHISIHTWPEYGYIAVDIFTCGEHAEPEKACKYLVQAFQASNHTLLTLPRGKLSPEIQTQLEESLVLQVAGER